MRKVMSVVNGVVELVERKPAESLSAGMFTKQGDNWKVATPVEQHVAKHITIELAAPASLSRRTRHLSRPSEVGNVNGVINCVASKPAKKKTYKQEGLQKKARKIAGFAGWK